METEMSEGGSAPPLIYSRREANRRPLRSRTMMFLCMEHRLVKSDGFQSSMGKWRHPRPINRHTSSKAASG